jgi:hypothetical protein
MQNDDVIDELRKEIAELRADLKSLNGAHKAESENTTEHITYIYKYVKMLDDRSARDLRLHVEDFKLLVEYLLVLQDSVSPLEEQIFPGVSKARQQLATIVKNLKVAAQEKDHKSP